MTPSSPQCFPQPLTEVHSAGSFSKSPSAGEGKGPSTAKENGLEILGEGVEGREGILFFPSLLLFSFSPSLSFPLFPFSSLGFV